MVGMITNSTHRKTAILREFGGLPRTFATTDETLQVKELFTGDGGKIGKIGNIGNIGDNGSNSGAGNGAMEHMITPLEAA